MKPICLTFFALLLSFASFAVAPITGTTGLCIGTTTTLSDITPGGTWTSSNFSVAATSGSLAGGVTGVSAGTATITYAAGGAYATITVTVNPSAAITGVTGVCLSLTTTLADVITGGTWTSSATAIATVGLATGIVAGLTPGTSIISYTNGTGCVNTTIVSVITSLPAISGSIYTCVGSANALTDLPPGGTWSSGTTAVATIVPATGILTGVSIGTSIVSYSIGGTCTTSRTDTVIAGVGAIIAPAGICTGTSVTLSDATLGGSWTSSNLSVAYMGSLGGSVTGMSAGTATISYSIGAGCTALATLSVYPNSPVSGSSSVCIGGTTTLSDAVPGGTWSSSATTTATVGLSSGIVTGVVAGTAAISYMTGSGCVSTHTESVISAPPALTGPTDVCTGSSNTLADAALGGIWSSSNTAIATISPGTGVVTGVGVGIVNITYTLGGGCNAVRPDTVVSVPAAISGATGVCDGASITLTDAGGGTWSSSNYSIANAGTTLGIVTGISAGTATITYSLASGCSATVTVTVYPKPIVTASLVGALCGSSDTLKAGGATTFSWTPVTGLSCPACAITSLDPTATTSYVVTGTDGLGCTNTGTIAVNGNRIYGHITFSSAIPDTLDMKVWLIHYNPADSSITALDSTTTCAVDSMGYYEFDGKAAGNYMVKAKLLYGNPVGASGYVPTYSLSSPYWYSGASVTHTAATDTLHITMVYGTVPAGPGFISGYVYSGAGKGTSGDVPVAGMQVYLRDASAHILTYTYTDATGLYSFSGLGYGNYITYPEDYVYHTTPSSMISVTAAMPSVTAVDFKQYTTSKTILPIATTGIKTIAATNALNVYPNPTTGILNIQWNNQPAGSATIQITDITGREVYKTTVNMNTTSGLSEINAESLKEGIYFITIKSDNIYYTAKLMIQQ